MMGDCREDTWSGICDVQRNNLCTYLLLEYTAVFNNKVTMFERIYEHSITYSTYVYCPVNMYCEM